MPDRNEYTPGTPSWVDVATTDMAASKQFYTQLFGWEFEDQEGAPYSMAMLRGRAVAGLGTPPGDVHPAWNTYVTVTDVEAAVATVEKAGGSVLAPAMDVMDAGRMAVLIDPTGAVFQIWQAKNSIGCEIVNEPNTYSWNELMTPDVDTAAAFYEQVFGWKAEAVPGMDYTVFNLDGEGIGGAMKSPMEGIPPHWAVYFTVADTDASTAKAKELGATVLAGPDDIPDVGRFATLTDPQGASFSIIKNANPPA